MVLTCHCAKFGVSAATSPLPRGVRAQNLIISKLAKYELTLKIVSQSVHNILVIRHTNEQTETIA